MERPVLPGVGLLAFGILGVALGVARWRNPRLRDSGWFKDHPGAAIILLGYRTPGSSQRSDEQNDGSERGHAAGYVLIGSLFVVCSLVLLIHGAASG